MVFPKDEKEGSQYNYVCVKKPYIHVGLQKNKLSNNEKYPYIPCCFEKDQTNKNSSYFKEYFLGEKKKKGIQQNVLVKNKFVQQNEVAILPENLNKLFESIDDNYNYYRKGVVSDVNKNQSFLATSDKEMADKWLSEYKPGYACLIPFNAPQLKEKNT
jgi:hypothetical protein